MVRRFPRSSGRLRGPPGFGRFDPEDPSDCLQSLAIELSNEEPDDLRFAVWEMGVVDRGLAHTRVYDDLGQGRVEAVSANLLARRVVDAALDPLRSLGVRAAPLPRRNLVEPLSYRAAPESPESAVGLKSE